MLRSPTVTAERHIVRGNLGLSSRGSGFVTNRHLDAVCRFTVIAREAFNFILARNPGSDPRTRSGDSFDW